MIKFSRLLMFRRTCLSLQQCAQCVTSTNASNIFSHGGLCLQRNVSSKVQERYSSDEQKLILQVLNEKNTEELKKFAVSKQRAENLYNFRTMCGPFTSLNQVLQVKSFGEHMLEQVCDKILVLSTEDPSLLSCKSVRDTDIPKGKLKLVGKSRVPLAVPILDKERIDALETVVGVHIGPNAISWASIDKSGNLLQWDLFYLNVETKKLHPTSILEVVMDVRTKIPDSDVYVMEDALVGGQITQQQVNSLAIQLHKSQLSAMLLVMLNATRKSLDNDVSTNSCLLPVVHRVFYLRSRSSARLFRTLVGSERVSAHTVVEEIMSPTSPHHDYSPVAIDHDLKSFYASKSNIEKEHLCQSLLLTMAFMDLVVYGNPKSITLATRR